MAIHVRLVRFDPVFRNNLLCDCRDGFINVNHRQIFEIAPEHDMSRTYKTIFQIFFEFLIFSVDGNFFITSVLQQTETLLFIFVFAVFAKKIVREEITTAIFYLKPFF